MYRQLQADAHGLSKRENYNINNLLASSTALRARGESQKSCPERSTCLWTSFFTGCKAMKRIHSTRTKRAQGKAMKIERLPLADKIATLSPLLSQDNKADYFDQPSMLQDVPSYNSTSTAPGGAVFEHAELGRRSR